MKIKVCIVNLKIFRFYAYTAIKAKLADATSFILCKQYRTYQYQ